MKSLGDKEYKVPFTSTEIWVCFNIAYNFGVKRGSVSALSHSSHMHSQVSLSTECSDVSLVHSLPERPKLVCLFACTH